MDSYSGSLPRRLISFRLGKTPNQGEVPTQFPNNVPQESGGPNSCPTVPEKTNLEDNSTILNTPVKSPSSLGANEVVSESRIQSPFAEKTSSSGDKCSDSESVGSFIEKFLSEKEHTEASECETLLGDNKESSKPGSSRILLTNSERVLPDPRLAKRRADSANSSPELGSQQVEPAKQPKQCSLESPFPTGAPGLLGKSSLSEKLLIGRRDLSLDHSYLRATQVQEKHPDSMTGFESNLSGIDEVGNETEKEANDSLKGVRVASAAVSVNVLKTTKGISVAPGESEAEAEEYGTALFQKGGHEMSGDSHTLISQCFEENPPVRFPSGHTSVSFSEPQMSCLVKTVAEETSIASFRMMKDILLKAAALRPLHDHKVPPSAKFRSSKTRVGSSSLSSGDESVDYRGKGYDSTGMASEDGFRGLVYCKDTNVPSDGELAAVSAAFDSQFKNANDPESTPPTTPICSQGSNDLEPLSLVRDKARLALGKSVVRKPASARNASRQKVPDSEKPYRPTRILKEESFDGLEWTRVFASGPLDPEDHMYSFYCLLCKKNVSMYGKGRSELVRHYQRKSHLRIDQRWRYEHLRRYDLVSGVPKHYVRGFDGKLLDHVELQRELPLFENAQLVEIGARLPYYGDYIQGLQHSGVTFEDRASIQLSIFCKFLPCCSNLTFLSHFWSEVGSITNHQSLFIDFDWSTDRFSVSIEIFVVYFHR